jgi:hypothetical protein
MGEGGSQLRKQAPPSAIDRDIFPALVVRVSTRFFQEFSRSAPVTLGYLISPAAEFQAHPCLN